VFQAWQAGHKVVVYCEDTRRLASFDRLLWEFAPLSFIPHVSVRHPLAERTPVLLTARPDSPEHDAELEALTGELRDFVTAMKAATARPDDR